MVRIAACTFSLLLSAGVANADVLEVHDETGAKVELETGALDGCRIVFDSAGAPFEICRMKRVELTPPNSVRARPGQTTDAGEREPEPSAVIYTRAKE